MLRKTLIALTMAGAMIATPIVYADQACKSPHCQCSMDKSKFFDKLNLDKAQREKIKAIKEEMREQMKANRDQMRDFRKQMRSLVTSDTLDNAMLDKLVNEKAELMKSMMKARITAKNKMYNVLNPEQKEKVKKMMEDMDKKMTEMRDKKTSE